MKVKELVYKLDYLANHNFIDENTEIVFFAEDLPGTARQLDDMSLNINGDCLQLFMIYKSRKGKGPWPLNF